MHSEFNDRKLIGNIAGLFSSELQSQNVISNLREIKFVETEEKFSLVSKCSDYSNEYENSTPRLL